MDFKPVATRKSKAGWTADKQRIFIEELATSWSVAEAAAACFMSPASAYRLRGRPEAREFAEAWNKALECAGGRLLAHAFDRALKGGYRRVWKNGELAVEELVPSDRLLMWLLGRIGPSAFRAPGFAQPPATLADLRPIAAGFRDEDIDAPALSSDDFSRPYEEPTTGL